MPQGPLNDVLCSGNRQSGAPVPFRGWLPARLWSDSGKPNTCRRICSGSRSEILIEMKPYNQSFRTATIHAADVKEIAMSTTTLNLARPSTRHPKRTASISAEKFAQLTVVEQVRQAFQPDGRLAALIGLLLGSSIPAMTFGLVHFVLPHHADNRIVLWVIAAGGLAYSAPKVFRWGVSAWGSTFEAAGMVLILEGIMTFVPGLWLPSIALLVVVFINGVYSACRLQIRQ